MAVVCFHKPEVVISQPWIEISSKFGMAIQFDIPKRVLSQSHCRSVERVGERGA